MFSFPECVIWLAVGLTECVAIVTLNIITIIVFTKNRNLRKRSTYLVVNLAVADVLVGGFATYELLYWFGVVYCNVWKFNLIYPWAGRVLFTLLRLFLFSSPTNMAAISLERLHATLRPFRHRLIKKWVYALIIALVWVTAGLLSIAVTVITVFKDGNYLFYLYGMSSFTAICLLVICISYASIVIKVRCGAQPQHHGAASRERKLTMTLLIVTLASLLLYLPQIIYQFLFNTDVITSMSIVTSVWLESILLVLFYANSLVNPILYAMHMPEYRSGVLAIFRRRPLQQVAVFSLPNM